MTHNTEDKSKSELLDKILTECTSLGGSDIFIQSDSNVFIKSKGGVSKTNITTSAKETMDIAEHIGGEKWAKSLDFDGAFSGDDNNRWRYNIFFQKNKPSLVLRAVNETPPNLVDMNLPSMIEGLCGLKQGLILVGGATGSGKSTTLAAMIDHINANMKKHIVTIEDPIECIHKNKQSIVSQRELGKDTASFEDAIKSALRQAPDVIVMGEIRTKESLDMAIKFSETGHLCMGTIHSKTASETFNRIISLYPEGDKDGLFMMLSMNVSAFIIQKLIPNTEGKMSAVFEVMVNSPTIKKHVSEGDIQGVLEVIEKSPDKEMITMDQSLFELFKSGKITKENVMANAVSKTNLLIMLSEWEANSDDAVEERAKKISSFSIKD